MQIKICGLTRLEETEYLNKNNVDYAGFVFYEPSKRNLSFEKAEEIMEGLNPSIKKVAVVVSPDVKLIEDIQKLDFDIIQIHKQLKDEVIDASKLPIWYALNVSDEDEAIKKQEALDSLEESRKNKIEAVLVDAPDFGSGKPFNWHRSRRMLKAGAQSPPGRKFILAGGLNENNVKEGIGLFCPDIVDVSSSVEGENGKDEKKIEAFVKAARES